MDGCSRTSKGCQCQCSSVFGNVRNLEKFVAGVGFGWAYIPLEEGIWFEASYSLSDLFADQLSALITL
jgi:hypothetical protein